MPKLNILGGSGEGRSAAVNASRSINLYPELDADPESKAVISLVKTPGISVWATIGNGANRGQHVFNGVNYVVSGNGLYSVTATGVVAGPLGTLATDNGRVSMTDNGLKASGAGGDQLIIVDGTAGYVYNVITEVFQQLRSYPAVQATAALDVSLSSVSAVNLISPGNGGVQWPVATVDDATGSGAVLRVNIGHPINTIYLSSYSTVVYPGNITVVITDPTGKGAKAEPTYSFSTLTGVLVTDGGHGYTNPAITLVDKNGNVMPTVTGVQFDMTRHNINSIDVVSGGSGYTAPTVSITGGMLKQPFELTTLSDISGNGAVVTVKYINHPLVTGDVIVVMGDGGMPTQYDNSLQTSGVVVTKIDANTFTYPGTAKGIPVAPGLTHMIIKPQNGVPIAPITDAAVSGAGGTVTVTLPLDAPFDVNTTHINVTGAGAGFDGVWLPVTMINYHSPLTFTYPGSGVGAPSSISILPIYNGAGSASFKPASMLNSGGTVTVTQASHGLSTGYVISVHGAVPSGYDTVSAAVTVLSSSQFTYASAATGALTTLPAISCVGYGANANGAQVSATFSNTVTGITVDNGGSGYINPPVITVTGPVIPPFTPTASNVSGSGTVVTIIYPGHGMATGGTIRAMGSTTDGYNTVGATITVIDANTFTYPGTGTGTPSTPPTIINVSSGITDTATATVVNSSITSISFTGGTGFAGIPTITISAPEGVFFPDNPSKVCYIDSYFILTNGTMSAYASEIFDGTLWNALAVAPIQSAPDNVQHPVSIFQMLLFIKEHTSEFFYDAGTPTSTGFPFARQPGAVIPFGTSSPWSVCRGANSLFWLADEWNGEKGEFVGPVMLQGMSPVPIGSPAIVYRMGQWTDRVNAFGYCYSESGHTFIMWTSPGDNETFVYDTTTQMWHERSTYPSGRHISNSYAYFAGKHLVGDWRSGNIYQMDSARQTDAGQPIVWTRRSPTLFDESDLQKLFIAQLQIDVDSTVTTGTAAATTALTGGAVTGVTLTDGGFDYTESPQVLLVPTDANGSGATAECTVENGSVTGITVTAGGAGYTDPPQVVFVDPPVTPNLALSYSIDDGRTWSSEKIRPMRGRVMFNRLGQSRNRIWQITGSDPATAVLLGGYAWVEK